MSSVTVYGRHSLGFFFSDAYSVFVCKVYYLLALFLSILYRAVCSSAFMLYTAYHKVCSVYHAPIADLDSGLWVSFGRFSAHLNFIIIVKVLLFVVTVLRFRVWQDERKMSIAVTVTADSSLNGSRSKQVEIAVPSDQEFDIFFLHYKVMQELVKTVFYLQSTLYVSMPEKADSVYFHALTSFDNYYIHSNIVYVYCQAVTLNIE